MPEVGGMPRLLHRPLKVYAFDPTQGKTLGNYMTVDVNFEELEPGPVGNHLMVIDYDASNHCYYAPVNLDDRAILLRGGLDPSETNPQFHQQMVYAVASETIRRFEFALGRAVKWRFQTGARNDPRRNLLRIFPHAMQEANAFYSRELRALVFGYFTASLTDAEREAVWAKLTAAAKRYGVAVPAGITAQPVTATHRMNLKW